MQYPRSFRYHREKVVVNLKHGYRLTMAVGSYRVDAKREMGC
jgi:hypothetical protein